MSPVDDLFRIARPEALWLLWLVPALVVFLWWSHRRKQRLLQRLASADLIDELVVGRPLPSMLLRSWATVGALALSICALVGMQYGYRWQEVTQHGVDLVIALDVSDSMLVRDADADDLTRLDRAKREIHDLLGEMEGDRVALVAFSGSAFVQCPMTLDYAAAAMFLRSMDTSLIARKGTAIGRALRVSLDAFAGSEHESKAILLITDGEDHTGNALQAAAEAKEAGVRVFAIGIGQDEGAPIPDGKGGLRRDASGELVLSKLDEATLQEIAVQTGGRYVRSVATDLDLQSIYQQGIKATLVDQELASTRRRQYNDRFQWLIAAAIVLLMLEPFVPRRLRA